MTVFDKMKIEFLTRLKDARDEVHFLVGELAGKYGIQETYVREKLVEWHNDKLIRLSGFHQSAVTSKPLGEWPNSEYFFNYALDGNRKRVRLLARGAEFLEELSADESESQGAPSAFTARIGALYHADRCVVVWLAARPAEST